MWLAFFLIVPSIIIVTIFLVHSIAKRVGFKVKYFSLILCAVMAFAVNLVAIKMSTYLDNTHYIKLAALIMFAAVIVTLINKYLINHEKTEIRTITDEEVEEELALEVAEIEAERIANEKKAIIKAKESIKAEEPIKIEKPVKVKEPIKKAEVKIEKTVKVEKPIKVAEPVKATEQAKIDKPAKVEQKVEINSEIKVIKPFEPERISKSEIKEIKPKTEPIKEVKVKTEPIEEVKPKVETIKEKPKVEKKAEVKAEEPVKVEPVIEKEIPEVDRHLGSLDDILDYAYSQKAKGDLKEATVAYIKALNQYKNDDYAPFIAIDLGNIYKEQAAYTNVIKTYEEALKLPAVKRNEDTKKEFERNLKYIKILQAVLIRHRALTMPFNKIPRQYIQEADNEFKALQMKSSLNER